MQPGVTWRVRDLLGETEMGAGQWCSHDVVGNTPFQGVGLGHYESGTTPSVGMWHTKYSYTMPPDVQTQALPRSCKLYQHMFYFQFYVLEICTSQEELRRGLMQ